MVQDCNVPKTILAQFKDETNSKLARECILFSSRPVKACINENLEDSNELASAVGDFDN